MKFHKWIPNSFEKSLFAFYVSHRLGKKPTLSFPHKHKTLLAFPWTWLQRRRWKTFYNIMLGGRAVKKLTTKLQQYCILLLPATTISHHSFPPSKLELQLLAAGWKLAVWLRFMNTVVFVLSCHGGRSLAVFLHVMPSVSRVHTYEVFPTLLSHRLMGGPHTISSKQHNTAY